MKPLRTALSIALGIAIAASPALSQEKTSDAEKAKIAAYMELAKPGPEHKQLESLVGTWDQEIKFFMAPRQAADDLQRNVSESHDSGRPLSCERS
jgi:hypothetical protein